MKTGHNFQLFLKELEQQLPHSNGSERSAWAQTIIQNDFDVKRLLPLATQENRLASRFLWLLSDIAEVDHQRLLNVLPELLGMRKEMVDVDSRRSFARYWHLYGLPEENEGEAIDLLFNWLIASDTNVSTKRHAVYILLRLVGKYPELKIELKTCLESELGKHTATFEKLLRESLLKLP